MDFSALIFTNEAYRSIRAKPYSISSLSTTAIGILQLIFYIDEKQYSVNCYSKSESASR